jgi:FkbM family methyltransferase
MSRIAWYRKTYRELGLGMLMYLQIQKFREKFFSNSRAFEIVSKRADHPLLCRPRTSDLKVFRQIFVDREYRCLDHVDNVELIVDCGANVGYSAAYLLTKFPNAQLIAIEPDPDNFKILERNLARYGDRVRAIQSAVWSRPVGLTLDSETQGSEMEWGRKVRPVVDGEKPTLNAIDIGSVLADSCHDSISILKVDIEGAEMSVFGENYERWLPRVDNIVIELHGDQCKKVFDQALESQEFMVSTCDELTVCEREQSWLESHYEAATISRPPAEDPVDTPIRIAAGSGRR